MNSETFRKMNVCFIIDGCPRCRILYEFIGRINQKLPPSEKIKIVDCTYMQRFGIVDELSSLYAKHFDGFPTIFIHGLRIAGCNSKIESLEQIKTLLEDYFVVPEISENKFIKSCSYIKRGLFRNKIVCRDE